MSEYYEKIRDERNKEFPPKHEFGCKIITAKDQRIYKHDDRRKNSDKLCLGRIQEPVIGTIVAQSVGKRSVGYGKWSTPAFYCVSENNNSPWRTVDKNVYKTLGKDLTLSDIILLLPEYCEFDSSGGMFTIYNGSKRLNISDDYSCTLWLDIPIKDQGEEDLRKLYNIIKSC